MPKPRLAPRAVVQRSGLVAGPLLAGACYLVLPEHYRDAAGGELVPFTAAELTAQVYRIVVGSA